MRCSSRPWRAEKTGAGSWLPRTVAIVFVLVLAVAAATPSAQAQVRRPLPPPDPSPTRTAVDADMSAGPAVANLRSNLLEPLRDPAASAVRPAFRGKPA